ncbi:MAG: alanine--glyoxylate aminotransferase family protein [Anaerolineae bacterium]|nr:alanine--glyoxylate aminotransferase family protein [Anaerolineae bacterium]
MTDYHDLNLPTRWLHGPGPSDTHPRVLRVMATPAVGYTDPVFIQMLNEEQELLRGVFQTRNPLTLPVSGTGTSGMEACIANLVEPGDKVLVCVNGYFGERLFDIAARYGGDVARIEAPWGEPFNAQQIADALKQRPAKLVAIVHAETSTGVLQPLADVAKVVHDAGALLLVDAVTSLGGVAVAVDEIGIDACYSCSQKCLGAPSGLAPVTLSPRAVEAMQKRKTKVSSFYLDLTLIDRYWSGEHIYHHTVSTSMNYALREALRIIHEEGLDTRIARHRANAETFWQGLEALDLTPHVPEAYRLPSLTTVRIPDGVDDMAIRKRLLTEYNIEIGGGLGALKGKVWRIGLMGYASTRERVTMLLGALDNLLHHL